MENTVGSFPKAFLNRVRPKDHVHLQIPLNAQKVLLGRSEQADFHFLDTKISRSHALFEYNFASSQWTVRSQGLNGLWLNGSQIPKDTPVQLKSQDLIQLGPEDYYVYKFVIEADEEEPRTKKPRLDSMGEVLKSVSEYQNVSNIASQSEALKSLIASQNAKEAQLQQERQTLEQRILTQSQEKKKMREEYQDLQELFQLRTTELGEEFLVEKAKLEAKVAQSALEQAEIIREKAVLEAKYLQETAELHSRLQDEKGELERRIAAAELHATEMQEKLSRLLESFEDLKQEKTRLEERLEGERRQFEAVTSELEAKLAQEKHDLEERWRKEKADLEKELAEEKALLESRIRSESVLRQEKADIEQRYQERNAALEAQLAEMQAQLEERANNEFVRLGNQVFGEQQQCMSSNPVVIIEGRNAIEPFVNEMEDLRGMLEKSEDQKKKMETAVESELECSICSELFINATAPSCGHSFCEWCLKEWRKRKQDCPSCRVPIAFTSRMRVLDNIVDALVRNLPEDARQKRETVIKQRQEALNAAVNVPAATSRPGIQTAVRGRRGSVRRQGAQVPTITLPEEPPIGRRRGAAVQTRPPRSAGPAPSTSTSIRARNDENSRPDATITLSSGSDSSDSNSNSEDETDTSMYSDAEDEMFHIDGDPYAYYGGYGRCFNCGSRGHWAPGCPFR